MATRSRTKLVSAVALLGLLMGSGSEAIAQYDPARALLMMCNKARAEAAQGSSAAVAKGGEIVGRYFAFEVTACTSISSVRNDSQIFFFPFTAVLNFPFTAELNLAADEVYSAIFMLQYSDGRESFIDGVIYISDEAISVDASLVPRSISIVLHQVADPQNLVAVVADQLCCAAARHSN